MIRRAAALAVLLGLLAACGVPAEDRPRVVEAARGPFPSPATAVSADSVGPITETLCLARDDRLVPVRRRVDRSFTVDAHLQHLLAGPTVAERDEGFTTALPGAVGTASAVIDSGQAQVTVTKVGDDSGRSDEMLAFGQIVCTLTSRHDVTTVSFRSDGKPLGVPRGDLSLSFHPLARTDYAAVIGPR